MTITHAALLSKRLSKDWAAGLHGMLVVTVQTGYDYDAICSVDAQVSRGQQQLHPATGLFATFALHQVTCMARIHQASVSQSVSE